MSFFILANTTVCVACAEIVLIFFHIFLAYKYPPARNTNTMRKSVREDSIVVHTTS